VEAGEKRETRAMRWACERGRSAGRASGRKERRERRESEQSAQTQEQSQEGRWFWRRERFDA
jgi:hypothetical protein